MSLFQAATPLVVQMDNSSTVLCLAENPGTQLVFCVLSTLAHYVYFGFNMQDGNGHLVYVLTMSNQGTPE